jgi:iron complex outermembrane receptor protein
VLSPDQHARASATYGSFNTTDFDANIQSGDFDIGGTNTRAMANFQDVNSDGYLTLQTTARQNMLVKVQNEFAPGWTVTAFANYNGLFQHLNDNNGATAAQINAFGKNFALQNTNPNEGTYQAYNFISKKTDMDYVRVEGDLAGFTLDDTAYTYAYVNKTVSTTDIQQTAADILSGVTEGNGTTVNGVKNKDVPGYTKKNAYRVWGNILRLSHDFDFGWLTGQVRTGLWWENAATQRARFDIDVQQCVANGCDPWHGHAFADSSLAAKSPTKAAAYDGGFAEYNEHSSWNQYQPFVEIELHPLPDLTVTPGFKYVNWEHDVNAPLEQKTSPVVPFSGSFTTTRSLPFLMANYKLEQSWSVYAQYAQGIYIPDISSFEQKSPALTFPKAETTTNYQIGTVYYADNFTFDGDLYYIGVNNNIIEQACSQAPIFGPAGETCAIDTGTAFYRGVEGEGTYAFNDETFNGALDGLVLFMNGSLNSSKNGAPTVPGAPAAGSWVKQAPMWTEASGIVYKTDMFKVSLVNKLVGQQYSDATNTQFYKLGAYDNTDLKVSVMVANFELGVGLYNIFNERNLLSVGINDGSTVGANVHDLAGRGASLDQYYFQPSRSYQITVTGRF